MSNSEMNIINYHSIIRYITNIRNVVLEINPDPPHNNEENLNNSCSIIQEFIQSYQRKVSLFLISLEMISGKILKEYQFSFRHNHVFWTKFPFQIRSTSFSIEISLFFYVCKEKEGGYFILTHEALDLLFCEH